MLYVKVFYCEMRWSSDALFTLMVLINIYMRYERPNLIGGHKMNDIIKSIEAEQLNSGITKFSVGDTVRVYAKVKEGNRERLQVFEGTVIKRQNGGSRETFTVRKNSGGVGVEKTWPLHSPVIDRIEVIRLGKARRAKLFYLRDRVGKKAKVKELLK